MRRHIYILLLSTIIAVFLNNCGSSAAPVTPGQLPIVSFAEADSYSGGVVMQFDKSITGTSDADFSECTAQFTDAVSDEIVTDDSCGTMLADGTTVTLTGPSYWPNYKSECSMTFDCGGENATIEIEGAISSISKSSISSTTVPTYYSRNPEDTTQSVMRFYSQQLNDGTILPSTNAILPNIVANRGVISMCYTTQIENPSGRGYIANAFYFTQCSYTDNEDNIECSTPVLISSGDRLVDYDDDCLLSGTEDNSELTLIIPGESDPGDEGLTTGSIYVKYSADGGATFKDVDSISPLDGANDVAISDGVIFIAHDLSSSGNGCLVDGESCYAISRCTSDSCVTVPIFSGNIAGSASLAVSGNDVHFAYNKDNDSGYSESYLTSLRYSDGSFTTVKTYTLSNAVSDDSSIAGVSMDNYGKLLVPWKYDTSGALTLSVINPSTESVTSNTISGRYQNVTKAYLDFKSNAFHIYMVNLNSTAGTYMMFELLDSTINTTKTIGLDVTEALGSIGRGNAYVDRFGVLFMGYDDVTSDPDGSSDIAVYPSANNIFMSKFY
ncbi:hypothetical protein KKA47_06905 [bacterium]|nr:hypothetical protein [bacterium]